MRWLGFGLVLLLSTTAFGAQYTVGTNARGEDVLDRALTTTHQGLTKQQVLQRAVNRFLVELFEQQTSLDQSLLELKLQDSTPAAKSAANSALLAGITPPSLTAPADQQHPINVAIEPLTIVSSDADNRPVRLSASNLPPGLQLINDAITGTPTQDGVYVVTLRADKYPDGSVFATVTFTWTVTP